MNPYLIFVVAILVLSFVFNAVVELLNFRHARGATVPAELAGFCDEKKFQESQRYMRANTKYGLCKDLISLPVTLAFLLFGGFGWIDHLARDFSSAHLHGGEIFSGLCFFAILGVLSSLFSLPFSLYHTFVLEERFGFNKTSAKTFVLDLLKGMLLSVLLGGPILAGLLWFLESFGAFAWLYAWGFFTVVQILLSVLAPTFLMPLFNKFSPLAPGELRTAIEQYASAQKFALQGIFTMDGSKRSSKSNAFFTGFGRFRRVVFFDTLIGKQSTAELVAVLAHEIGHYKRKHILQSLLLSVLLSLLLFYFFSLFLKNSGLAAAFGVSTPSNYTSLVFILFLYAPISAALGVLRNIISRKFEFEADAFAAATTGRGEDLISALKKLSVDNLSNLNPHPLKVFFEYSHPPVVERIRRLASL